MMLSTYIASGSNMSNEYGEVGGITIGRGNQDTQRKSTSLPFCEPQIPHGLPWGQTRLPWCKDGDPQLWQSLGRQES
jgi:hypothetical protein